ncbi:MAG: PQQ-binding-like beta-propeller repeat protein [Candidatus Bathyarchaeota archaeon]|nr:PQQ-binding-like beta-propeller repeat protein [Candidatus Bathyarchaeota archaeon]
MRKAGIALAAILAIFCLLLISFGSAGTSTSVIEKRLLWKHTLPTYVITAHDFHNNYWSYNETQPFGSPNVTDGVVFIGASGGDAGDHDAGIHAFDAHSGKKLWNYSLDYNIYSPPTVVNGIIYIGSYRGLYAFNALTGNKLWNYSETWYYDQQRRAYQPSYNAAFHASPAISNGVVYAASDDGNLIAFNSNSGAILCKYPIRKAKESYPWYATFTSPVIVNGVIYIGSQDHSVYALSAVDGHKIWNFTTGGEVYAPLTVSEGVVYVSSYDGNVYALDALNGSKIWNFSVARDYYGLGYIDSSPVIVEGKLYVGCNHYLLYALDAHNGSELWSFNASSPIQSTPAVVNGVVYFGCEAGNLYALNASDGGVIWNYITDGPIRSSPVVSDGVLYVGTEAGSVYALGSPSSSKLTPTLLTTLKVVVILLVALASVVLLIVIFRRIHHRNKSSGSAS